MTHAELLSTFSYRYLAPPTFLSFVSFHSLTSKHYTPLSSAEFF